MKKVWIIVASGIVAAGVIIAGVRFLPYLKPQVEIKILNIEGKPKLGETLTINCEARNTGRVKSNFVVGFTYTEKTIPSPLFLRTSIALSPRQVEKINFISSVPEERKPGEYDFKVIIYSQDAKGNLQNLLGGDSKTLSIATFVVNATVKFTAEVGTQKAGNNTSFSCAVKNTGEIAHTFPASLNIFKKGSCVYSTIKEFSIPPEQQKTINFSYKIPVDMDAGTYRAQVTIFDRREPAGELILPYAKVQQDFNVIALKKEVTLEFARSVPSQKIGKELPIECLVKNTGEYGLSLSLILEVKPPSASAKNFKEELFAASGTQKKITFNYHIPDEIGNYRINAFLYEKDRKGNIIGKIGEVQQNFEVASLITNASIAILNKIGEKKVGEKILVNLQVRNTGETKRTFITSLTLRGREERNFPTREVLLSPGESSNLDFEYEVLPQDPAGAWRIIAGVWSEKKSDGTLGGKLDETLQEFKILDTPPKITFLSIGASANVGERVSLKIKVSDDRGITGSVKITYQFPGMDKKMTSEMTKISGTNQDGVWVFNTDAFAKPGKFMFFMETEDGAGQKVRTEELHMGVVVKK